MLTFARIVCFPKIKGRIRGHFLGHMVDDRKIFTGSTMCLPWLIIFVHKC